MGIESDKLVFDYLSRVGDLAHGTPMTAAERARLVSGLRTDIDRMRAEQGGAESKTAVRKILDGLGKPEDLVASANGDQAVPGVPGPRAVDDDAARPSGGGAPGPRGPGRVTRSRLPRLPPQLRKEPEQPPPAAPPVTAARGASPPHLAGMDELGPEESDPDWWRIDRDAAGPYERGGPYARGGQHGERRPGGDLVPGFVGGIELPELLKPPDEDEETENGAGSRGGRPGAGNGLGKGVERAGPSAEAPPGAAEEPAVEQGGGAAGRPARFRPFGGGGGGGGPRVGGLVELVAVALLAVGTVLGHLAPLGAGWLAAYWSPRLSRNEAKWAAMGMPALVAAGTMVWFWGRATERWGDPIPDAEGALGDAMSDAWPVVLRVAAAASAVFLLWRARRPLPDG